MENQSDRRPPEELVFGVTEEMRRVQAWVRQCAPTDTPVLIVGESGTGKQEIAWLLHAHSHRSANPFRHVNCPGIPGNLIESELFGFEQGAFTGAYEAKPGLVETAENGTLFLDEIGEMDQSLCSKLLHFLQDGSYSRIGGLEQKRANVRVVSATNQRLKDAVDDGAFRRDLFYRISVITLEAVPLRRRREDIPALVSYFVQEFAELFNMAPRSVSRSLMQLFLSYDWPGNVRELKNIMQRFCILGSEEAAVSDLLGSNRGGSNKTTKALRALTKAAVRDLERKIILQTLYENHWNRRKAATELEISYRSLFYKLKEAGIHSQAAGGEGVADGGDVEAAEQARAYRSDTESVAGGAPDRSRPQLRGPGRFQIFRKSDD